MFPLHHLVHHVPLPAPTNIARTMASRVTNGDMAMVETCDSIEIIDLRGKGTHTMFGGLMVLMVMFRGGFE